MENLSEFYFTSPNRILADSTQDWLSSAISVLALCQPRVTFFALCINSLGCYGSSGSSCNLDSFGFFVIGNFNVWALWMHLLLVTQVIHAKKRILLKIKSHLKVDKNRLRKRVTQVQWLFTLHIIWLKEIGYIDGRPQWYLPWSQTPNHFTLSLTPCGWWIGLGIVTSLEIGST